MKRQLKNTEKAVYRCWEWREQMYLAYITRRQLRRGSGGWVFEKRDTLMPLGQLVSCVHPFITSPTEYCLICTT